MPIHATGPLQFTWSHSKIPLVNGEVYPMFFFQPHGTPQFQHENQFYSCFESVHNLPLIQHIIHLEAVEEGHTYYMTSLDYDRNPYFQVIFVLVDIHKKKMYASWVFGRAEEARIELDQNTFAFDFIGQETRKIDLYSKKLGAARKANGLELLYTHKPTDGAPSS